MIAVEPESPLCVICGKPETYAHGMWFCRDCDKEESR